MASTTLTSLNISTAEVESGAFLSCSSNVTLDTGVDATLVGLQVSFYNAVGNLIVAVEPKATSPNLITLVSGGAEQFISLENIRIPRNNGDLTAKVDFEEDNRHLKIKMPADFAVPPTVGLVPVDSVQLGLIFSGAPTGTITMRRTILNRSVVSAPFTTPPTVAGGGGTITGVTAGTGLAGGGTTGSVTIDLDFSELTDMTANITGTTEFILQNGTVESRKAASEINLSFFNNDLAAADALTLGGKSLWSSGNNWDVIPFVEGTLGTIDIGKRIDFHSESDISPDNFDFRIETTNAINPHIDFINDSGVLVFEVRNEGGAQLQNNGILYFNGGTTDYIQGIAGNNVKIVTGSIQRFNVNSLGVQVVGDVAVTGTVDGRDVAADGVVLDGLTGGISYKGGYDAALNIPDLDITPVVVSIGDMYTVTVAGAFFNAATLEVGDVLIAEIDNAALIADWTIVNKNIDSGAFAVAGHTHTSSTISALDTGDTTTGVFDKLRLRSIQVADTRAVNDAPNAFDTSVQFDFKTRTVIGSPGNDVYVGVMTMAPWLDATGGPNYQLSFTNTTNIPSLALRLGDHGILGSDWGPWATILDDVNFVAGTDYQAAGSYPVLGGVNVYPGGSQSFRDNANNNRVIISVVAGALATSGVILNSTWSTGGIGNLFLQSAGNTKLKVHASGVDVTGIVEGGDGSSTNGSVGFQLPYSGLNKLNIFGSKRSSGATLIGFAARHSSITSDVYLSTVGNSTFAKGVLEVTDSLKFKNSPAAIVAIGSEVIMTERFAVDASGNLTLSGTVDGRDVAADGVVLDGLTGGIVSNNITVSNTSPTITLNNTDGLGNTIVSRIMFSDINDSTVATMGFDFAGNSDFVINNTLGFIELTSLSGVKIAVAKRLYFDGGVDTYIQEDTADNLRIVTGGVERFNANSSGVQVVGDVAVTGTVDGRDVAADGVVLDAVSTHQHTTITPVDESVDTTCNVAYFNSATGNQAIKTGTNLTFNSSTGELTASILNSSDISLKDVISNPPDMPKILSDVPIESWTWKKEHAKGRPSGIQFGYIAQIVEKVFPQAVSGIEGNKKVDYTMVHTVKIAELEKLVLKQQEQINLLLGMLNT